MKKFFVLLGILLFSAFAVHASGYTDFLNNVNDVMNVIDRTDYTINRVKNKIPKVDTNKTNPQSTTNTKTNSSVNQRTNNSYPSYQETDTSGMPLYQQNQGNTVQNVR